MKYGLLAKSGVSTTEPFYIVRKFSKFHLFISYHYHYLFISDENGKHGSIVRMNTVGDSHNSSLSATDGFRATLLTYNAVEVGLTNSEFVTIFVAPRSVYSGIHGKSVSLT